ncbi:MAG: ATPase domain-containing protein [Candidatus Rokuibacteriota bacterium]
MPEDPLRRASPRVATGIEGLDEILRGGLPENRLYLVEGEPGTGKTTLALQFLLEGASRGERGLYVTLSETTGELAEVARSHGWSLENVTLYELAATPEPLSADDQYTILHPSEVELGETTQAVFEEVERINPTRVVFDSLSEMRLLAREPLRYRRQILALKQFFVGRHCTVLLLDDRTADSGDLQLQSITHGVVRLEQLVTELSAERRRLRVIKLRGVNFRGGYHDFRILTGGMRVFPRVLPLKNPQVFAREKVKSGLPELDALLGGGLIPGTSALLMGPAGAGKSVVANQYAAAAAERGDYVAIYLFDEHAETSLVRADGLGLALRSHVDGGRITLEEVDPAQLSPGEFSERVRHRVENGGARIVVFDSLNGYLAAMPEERFLILQLHELLAYLNRLGVLSLMIVAEHGLIGSGMASPIDVSYLADTVLLFRYYEVAGEVRQAISVVKHRPGRHERTIRELQLGPGIQVGPPLARVQGVLSGEVTVVGTEKPQVRDGRTE